MKQTVILSTLDPVRELEVGKDKSFYQHNFDIWRQTSQMALNCVHTSKHFIASKSDMLS